MGSWWASSRSRRQVFDGSLHHPECLSSFRPEEEEEEKEGWRNQPRIDQHFHFLHVPSNTDRHCPLPTPRIVGNCTDVTLRHCHLPTPRIVGNCTGGTQKSSISMKIFWTGQKWQGSKTGPGNRLVGSKQNLKWKVMIIVPYYIYIHIIKCFSSVDCGPGRYDDIVASSSASSVWFAGEYQMDVNVKNIFDHPLFDGYGMFNLPSPTIEDGPLTKSMTDGPTQIPLSSLGNELKYSLMKS